MPEYFASGCRMHAAQRWLRLRSLGKGRCAFATRVQHVCSTATLESTPVAAMCYTCVLNVCKSCLRSHTCRTMTSTRRGSQK
eukprot:699054-Rhodomonas_salina.1